MQFARARDGLTIEAQNHVAFSQSCLFCGTVFDDVGHADAAHVTHAIGAHVFFGHVLSVDAEKCAALKEESEIAIAILPIELVKLKVEVVELKVELVIELKVEIEVVFGKFILWSFGGFWSFLRFWSFRRFGSFLSRNDDAARDQTATEHDRESQQHFTNCHT